MFCTYKKVQKCTSFQILNSIKKLQKDMEDNNEENETLREAIREKHEKWNSRKRN